MSLKYVAGNPSEPKGRALFYLTLTGAGAFFFEGGLREHTMTEVYSAPGGSRFPPTTIHLPYWSNLIALPGKDIEGFKNEYEGNYDIIDVGTILTQAEMQRHVHESFQEYLQSLGA